jgi:uncharacterized membrane protein
MSDVEKTIFFPFLEYIFFIMLSIVSVSHTIICSVSNCSYGGGGGSGYGGGGGG